MTLTLSFSTTNHSKDCVKVCPALKDFVHKARRHAFSLDNRSDASTVIKETDEALRRHFVVKRNKFKAIVDAARHKRDSENNRDDEGEV